VAVRSGGVERAGIGEGEREGDRLSGIDHAVDRSALVGQNRTGVDDLRGRVNDRGDVSGAVVGWRGIIRSGTEDTVLVIRPGAELVRTMRTVAVALGAKSPRCR